MKSSRSPIEAKHGYKRRRTVKLALIANVCVSRILSLMPPAILVGEALVSELPVPKGFEVVGRVGIEPTTKRLRVSCSTS
jgi:hypothetical protein